MTSKPFNDWYSQIEIENAINDQFSEKLIDRCLDQGSAEPQDPITPNGSDPSQLEISKAIHDRFTTQPDAYDVEADAPSDKGMALAAGTEQSQETSPYDEVWSELEINNAIEGIRQRISPDAPIEPDVFAEPEPDGLEQLVMDNMNPDIGPL